MVETFKSNAEKTMALTLRQESVLAKFRPRRCASYMSYLKPDVKGATNFLVHMLLSRDAAEARTTKRWHCFAGFLPEILDVSQVGNDVHSALAIDCSEKHTAIVRSFVHMS